MNKVEKANNVYPEICLLFAVRLIDISKIYFFLN